MLVHTPIGSFAAELDAYDLPPTFPVVLPICRTLGIAETVDRFCPMQGGDHLTHGQVVEFLILHLLQSPDRLPLYQLGQWAADHNVHRLYGCSAEEFNDDRVGRALEALAEAVPEIEAQVVTEALRQYHIKADTIHWDLTNVTFTGAYEGSELIRAGYGHGAMHERQLQVSLHTTGEAGIPVRHEVLAGNVHQGPLAPDMLQELQQRLPTSKVIVVSDRAGISYDNIVCYRRRRAYFLGPLQVTNPEHARALAAVPLSAFQPLSYHPINKPHETYACYPTTLKMRHKQGKPPLRVRALFVHSSQKQAHDAAQREKAIARALARLQQISGFLNQRQYARREYAQAQITKALRPVASFVHAELLGEDRTLTLHVHVDQQALAEAAASDGRYILVFRLPDEKSLEDTFMLYRGHGSIEQSFRTIFSELAIQPVWLHKEERIKGLLAVCILALIVYTLLELCSERAGLDSEYYHKLTARAIIRTFGRVYLRQIQVETMPPQRELIMSPDQAYIIAQLQFPDPLTYIDSS